MRYQLLRYFRPGPQEMVLRPRSFVTDKEVTPGLHDGNGYEAIFWGDTLDEGVPQVGKRFVLSNRFLYVPEGEERKQVITSKVLWASQELIYQSSPLTTEHAFDFYTKNSEYRISWWT